MTNQINIESVERKMEHKDSKDCYIGEIYQEDVYAYVNMKKDSSNASETPYWQIETGLVKSIREYQYDYTPFCWQAAITETLWYAYRGMIKEAIVFDAITLIFGGIILRFSWIFGILFFAFLAIMKGFLAVPLYYERIKKSVELRGLLMRSAGESEAAYESLKKEGKPSIMRAVFYLLGKCFAAICLDSILFSFFSMWG